MDIDLRIEDLNDSAFDPFDIASTNDGGELVDNLHDELRRMRLSAPVWEVDLRTHFGAVADLGLAGRRKIAVLGYEEAERVLLDGETFSNRLYEKNLGVAFGRSVTTMDAPEHLNFRKYFQAAFLRPMIAHWGEELIPNCIDGLIDKFAARGNADLVNEFTLLFPFHVIHELLALPEEDRAVFHKLAFTQIFISFDVEHATDAIEKLKNYLTAVVRHRRAYPLSEADLISKLARLKSGGELLPDDIIIAFFRQLMNAGGDTSYHGFSSVLAGLLTHPEQLEAVRADRSLIPQAIEEGLRWNSPVLSIAREPTREIELGGVLLRPGDAMEVVLASANRDEKRFPDADRFDIHRSSSGHIAFGHGGHVCIGRHLARMEMGVALNAVLDRLPGLRLDPAYPAPVVRGVALRGPHHLHVLFDKDTAFR